MHKLAQRLLPTDKRTQRRMRSLLLHAHLRYATQSDVYTRGG